MGWRRDESPDHVLTPAVRLPEAYTAGINMELEVEDATAALADEPFGQRRFSRRDPSGLWVNIVQQ